MQLALIVCDTTLANSSSASGWYSSFTAFAYVRVPIALSQNQLRGGSNTEGREAM